MRSWAATWLMLVLTASTTACTQASGPAAATKAPTYACITTIAGKAAACMQFSRVAGGPAVVARLKQGCLVVPGQTFGAACPKGGLTGCCTMRHPERGDAATCFYEGGPLASTPEQCAKDGGVWSATP